MLTLGDLAHSLVMRANQTRLRSQMQDLTTQVTTGQQSDLGAHFSGNLMSLSGVERTLSRLDSYALANTEVKARAEFMQTVLTTIEDVTGALSTNFLKVDLATAPAAREAIGSEAANVFETLVSGLNSQLAGRSLFSGTATDRAALDDSTAIIAALKTDVSGAATFSDLMARLDTWFDTAGGAFETLAYQGASEDLAALSLSDTEAVALPIRADNQIFRDLLKATAMGQLATDSDLGFSNEMQSATLNAASDLLLNARTGLIETMADLGAAQERIELTITRNSAERSATIMTRNAMVEADPYEAATQLSAVQYQLESLYTITARNRSLSLVQFL